MNLNGIIYKIEKMEYNCDLEVYDFLVGLRDRIYEEIAGCETAESVMRGIAVQNMKQGDLAGAASAHAKAEGAKSKASFLYLL